MILIDSQRGIKKKKREEGREGKKGGKEGKGGGGGGKGGRWDWGGEGKRKGEMMISTVA